MLRYSAHHKICTNINTIRLLYNNGVNVVFTFFMVFQGKIYTELGRSLSTV